MSTNKQALTAESAQEESIQTYYIHPAAFGGKQNPGHRHVPVVKAENFEKLRAKLEAAEKRIAELEARQVNEEVSDEELNSALQLHGLKVDGHSQLSDAFRAGFKYARRAAGITVKGELPGGASE